MNFFKSVFSDDDQDPSVSSGNNPSIPTQGPVPDENIPGSTWSFDGLMKTLATKSETVIGSYRRDFEEFGSELKKETSIIRRVASRAVKDLPESLEIGATVAQESLESVGQAIDDIGSTVWKSTAQIISQGRDTISSSFENYDPDSDMNVGAARSNNGSNQGLGAKRYSRFEMQLRAIQCDKSTYCREPEDPEDFSKWRAGFVLDDKRGETRDLIEENKVIKEIYSEVVPSEVDDEAFWSRYFYKVHKLQQAEEARAKLVKRAISGEEEDLRWDFDDEDEEANDSLSKLDSKDNAGGNVNVNANSKEKDEGDSDKGVVVDKRDNGETSCKDSDITVISPQPSSAEEDHGWDEIEDIGSNDEQNKAGAEGSKIDNADWRKRLTAAGDEEDLSWDIEDDDYDESVKH